MKNNLYLSVPIQSSIRELALSHDGPFYIYDTSAIRRNCQQFKDIPYTLKSIHFALMANANPQFIRLIKEAGLNVFVNSVLHLETVLQLGFRGEEIIYAASAMDEYTMRLAEACHSTVILDSIGQFQLWRSLFPENVASIRCNVGDKVKPQNTNAGYFIGKDSRLGFTIDEIMQLKGEPSIIGLHSYVGTDILDMDYFFACYERIAELAELFPGLQFLDFGGGFGLGEDASQRIDMRAYGTKVSLLMNRISDKLGRRIKLMLEPGRIIGGEAGYFVCRVTDIKERGDHQLIGVNASCVQFPRPLFYPDTAFHPIGMMPQNKASDSTGHLSSIYGCSTYSRDFLARDIMLPHTSVGDLVILGNAGSYCASAYTRFLGFPEAKEFFV